MKKYSLTDTFARRTIYPELSFIRQMGYGISKRTVKEGLKRHKNPGIEICYIKKGKFLWQVEGKNYSLRKGDVYITLPWQEHGGQEGYYNRGELFYIIIGMSGDGSRRKFNFVPELNINPGTCKWLEKVLLKNESPLVRGLDEYDRYYLNIWEELHRQAPGYEELTAGYVCNMLVSLARAIESRADCIENDELIAKVLADICSDLDYPWSLDEMAASAGLHRTQFAERVIYFTGFSPQQYLERMRLDKAKKLLAENIMPITQIAFTVGFSTSQYFASVFKKDTGITPGEFRKTSKNKRE